MNKKALINLVSELEHQIIDLYAEIGELRRENYQLNLRIKSLKKEWLQMLGANVNLANIIKSFDSEYFEKIGGVDEEGKSDYKGVQVQDKQITE